MAIKKTKAAAIRYRHKKDNAPKVIAKGSGKIAEKIIQIAKEHNIPIQDDPYLIEALSSLDLYEEIPPELYRAVAEVLVFIYRTSRREQHKEN